MPPGSEAVGVLTRLVTYSHKWRIPSFLLNRHRAAVLHSMERTPTVITSVIQRLSDVSLPGIAGNLGFNVCAQHTQMAETILNVYVMDFAWY